MRRLEDKVAVISGVGSGMGATASRRFCEEGATVVGVDVNEQSGRELEQEMQADGLPFTFAHADVSKSADVERVAAMVEDRFDGLGILYNNAGVCVGRHVLETTEDEWDRTMNATLKGSFQMIKAFAPLMKGHNGSIINVASTAALVGFANMSAYCAAKGGVLLLTKAAAADLAPDIRVNAICPGAIDTPMLDQLFTEFPGQDPSDVSDSFAQAHILKRLGTPPEVVALSIFLASDEASFFTGSGITVDGGWTAI